MAINRAQKLKSGQIQQDADVFVGEEGHLFFDFDNGILRRSDGVTPGGIPLFSPAGGSTATALFQTTAPTGVVNGTIWYNPNIDTLSVYENGAWIPFGPSIVNTDDLTEGTTNLFFTTERAASAIAFTVDKAFIDALNVNADTLDGLNSTDFATALQGTLATTALQPGAHISSLTNDVGYITSYTETDPIFSASPAATISLSKLSEWDTAYSWGNHADQGYITNLSEIDSVFTSSPAYSISTADINNWNVAYNWGNHADVGYALADNVLDVTTVNLTGGAANQILVKQSNNDYDYAWEDMIIQLPQTNYTKLLDDTSTANTLYLGEADPESLEADAVWRIQRIVFDTSGNVDEVRFALGGNFDQIWDNRTSLTYI